MRPHAEAVPPGSPAVPLDDLAGEPAEAARTIVGRVGLLLVANLSALTGLLVYFGWRRSETQAQALGVDESIFGLTTQEYVLRSVGPVFALLALLGVVLLAWLWFDHWLARLVSGRAWAVRWVGRLLVVASAGPFVAAYAAQPYWPAQAYVAFPLAISAGLLMLWYRTHLRQRYGARAMPRYELLRGLVALGCAVCVFWSVSNYAEVLGDFLAEDFSVRLAEQPAVVVYSSDPLHLDTGAVETETVGPDGAAFRYRYSGLRFMDRRGGRYFLVARDWSLGRGTVIVLRDDERIRLEFVRG